MLSGTLLAESIRVGDELSIDGVFRYRKGDEAGRAEATQYGLSVGCPADQLDWPD